MKDDRGPKDQGPKDQGPATACLFHERCPSHNTLLRVPKGTTIFTKDQRTSSVFHIHSGIVGVFRTCGDGRESIDSLVAAPHLIGVAGFVEIDGKRPVYHAGHARAITPIVYCKTRREDVWDLLDDRGMRAEIMNMICGTFFTMTILSAASDFRLRVMIILDLLVQSIGVQDDQAGGIVIPGVTHDDIACVSGMTRPTVSRVLEEMEERGTITIGRRHIVLRQPEVLRQELQMTDAFEHP